MQFVDINGKTLPEIIKEYEEKINSLYETTKKRTVYTSAQGFDSINTMYQLSDVFEQERIDTGSIIYFSENGWLAIARNIDKTVGSYYVINPVQIKGDDGKNGKEIVNIELYNATVEDETTVTTNKINFNNETTTLFSVVAQNGKNGRDGTNGTNGKSVTNAHTVSHRVVGDETVTNVEFVIDGVTPNPTVEIHAQNGANGTADIPYIEITSTNGTLTREQFNLLNTNKNAYIRYADIPNRTIEKFNFSQSTSSDAVNILIYSRELTATNGIGSTASVIVTDATASIVYNLYRSAREYRHYLFFENSDIDFKAYVSVINKTAVPIDTIEKFYKIINKTIATGNFAIPGAGQWCTIIALESPDSHRLNLRYFVESNHTQNTFSIQRCAITDTVEEINYNGL